VFRVKAGGDLLVTLVGIERHPLFGSCNPHPSSAGSESSGPSTYSPIRPESAAQQMPIKSGRSRRNRPDEHVPSKVSASAAGQVQPDRTLLSGPAKLARSGALGTVGDAPREVAVAVVAMSMNS
jgi:hypothetical protein